MIHNTVKGVYGAGGFAAITVRYPVGATCRCSLSGTTLTDSGSGLHTFFVPYSGNWVITVSSGSLSNTTTVSIVNIGDNKYVELWFDSGINLNTGVWSPYGQGTITADGTYLTIKLVTAHTGGKPSWAFTTNKIRWDGYSKVRIHISASNNIAMNTAYMGLCITPASTVEAFLKKVNLNNAGPGYYELDVEEITGEYYLQIGFLASGLADPSITIDEVMLYAI